MAYAARLATFVHISDLHFGDIDPRTHQVAYPRWMIHLWTIAPFFTGLAGHEYPVLVDLQQFFEKMESDEQAQLIVTGDLTSAGDSDQFASANDFLERVLVPPKGNQVGLQVAGWEERGIPGNHDHWPGTFFSLGPPLPPLRNWFRNFPYVGSPIPLPGTAVRVRFIGSAIDTDANVYPGTPERVLARGAFPTQLSRLTRILPSPSPHEIRVLLLHHSPAHQGYTLEINPGSRKYLEQLLVTKDIPIILTGHTHQPLVCRFRAISASRVIEYLEGRSGTTTQTPRVPLGWPSSNPTRALDANTLLVHRLFLEDDGKIVWHAETFQHLPRRGFQKAIPKRSEPWEDRLVVWPRP